MLPTCGAGFWALIPSRVPGENKRF
jgi:hypothetical protein